MKIKAKEINERLAENYTKIKINGIAEIIHDNNVIRVKNKFTRYLMSSIIVFIADSTGTTYDGPANSPKRYVVGMAYGCTAKAGNDTTTPTTPDMTDLANKIDISPSSLTRRLIKEPDYTLYIAEFIFVWNIGRLPDTTIGEFGVYLTTDNDDWASGTINPARVTCVNCSTSVFRDIPLGNADVRLASRIASADGAFDPFEFHGSINSLTFKWRFQVAIV